MSDAVESVGMRGARFDVLCRKGATVGPVRVTWQDDAGTPVDLYNRVITAKARRRDTADTYAFTVAVIGATSAGTFELSMGPSVLGSVPAPATTTSPPTVLDWECVVTEPSGTVTPLAYGELRMGAGL